MAAAVKQKEVLDFLIATRRFNPRAGDPTVYTELQIEELISAFSPDMSSEGDAYVWQRADGSLSALDRFGLDLMYIIDREHAVRGGENAIINDMVVPRLVSMLREGGRRQEVAAKLLRNVWETKIDDEARDPIYVGFTQQLAAVDPSWVERLRPAREDEESEPMSEPESSSDDDGSPGDGDGPTAAVDVELASTYVPGVSE